MILWHQARKFGCTIPINRTWTAILAFVISLGLLFASVGAVLIHIDLVKRQRYSQCTHAVVVDHILKRSGRASKHHRSYYAIVEFNANGQTIRATSSMGWPDRRYKIGKELAIRYNPNDLHEVLIKGERNMGPAFFILFGLFFCVVLPILMFTQYDGKRLRQIKARK